MGKDDGEDKYRKFEEIEMDRGEGGVSRDGYLVDDAKKKMMKNRTKKEDSEDVENWKGGKRGVGKENEARIASTKPGAEKKEDETDKATLKSGEGSVISPRAKQFNEDVNAKPDRKCNQSNPPVVVVLSLSRRDSSNKQTREKAEGSGKKPSEGRKRKSNGEETEFDTFRTTSGLKKKKRASGEKSDEKDSKSCRLPLNRVRTIVKSDNSNIKITQESYFLICKATECFIEQFCKDAFSLAASHGLKKLLKYDHLASLVYNMDRYDFLSDYVPWKIKAKEALAETKTAEDRKV